MGVQFCCFLHTDMRLVVVSLLVLLACAACVSAQAGAPEIRRVSIADLLNDHPELRATLAEGIEKSRRESKTNNNSPTVTKPKRPKPAPVTTTSSPVPQADTPAEPPAATTP